jgi:DNA-binding NarL/FixJ family response regulator
MKILIADGTPHNRENLATYLMQNGFDIAGTAASGEEARNLALELSPEIIILDINLSDVDILELTASLTNSQSEPAVILLTVSQDPEIVQRGIQAGAYACLAKNDGVDPLVEIIQDLKIKFRKEIKHE